MAEAILIAEIEKNSRELIRVSLDEFKGHRLCDIRIFAIWGSEEDARATKKGISIKVEKLPALIAALQAAAAVIEGRVDES